MKFFILLLISQSVLAADFYQLSEEELNPSTEDVLIKQPEKYLRNEMMIYDLNTDLGIKDQRKYTGTDKNRLSFAGHLSGDYEHLTETMGADVTYMRRTDNYDRIWWGFQFFQHRTRFDAVAEPQTDEAPTRPGDARGILTAAGLGLSYRFKLLLDFWPAEDRFENIDVFVNYLDYQESFLDKSYRGYGLTTSYGFIKRSSNNFYYGPKISYNIAPVTRDRIDTAETSKRARTMTLGWLTAAFEIGFFY